MATGNLQNVGVTSIASGIAAVGVNALSIQSAQWLGKAIVFGPALTTGALSTVVIFTQKVTFLVLDKLAEELKLKENKALEFLKHDFVVTVVDQAVLLGLCLAAATYAPVAVTAVHLYALTLLARTLGNSLAYKAEVAPEPVEG